MSWLDYKNSGMHHIVYSGSLALCNYLYDNQKRDRKPTLDPDGHAPANFGRRRHLLYCGGYIPLHGNLIVVFRIL